MSALTQGALGGALLFVGQHENGTARLEEAVAAFRNALQEWTRERTPPQWAATQNGVGAALATFGLRESGTARLEEAVTTYRDVLQEWTRERWPLQWAATQINLGGALAALGSRESGSARLEEAVTAYRHALRERTRERGLVSPHVDVGAPALLAALRKTKTKRKKVKKAVKLRRSYCAGARWNAIPQRSWMDACSIASICPLRRASSAVFSSLPLVNSGAGQKMIKPTPIAVG